MMGSTGTRTRPPRIVLERVLLAAPRGYCAGVRRAIAAVEQGIADADDRLYVRHQIVHNVHVVAELERRGAAFVDDLDEVPAGSRVVFSAHGVAPAVEGEAARRRLRPIDATCPLVAKVHAEVRHYAERGYTIFLIGHRGHDEVEGTTGVAPEAVLLIETRADAERVEPPRADRLAYVTQTTLGLDDTAQIVAVLRRRFPGIEAPRKADICYATTNRQRAVAALLPEIDLLLVIGSANSSNSRRLVELAESGGVPAHLVEDETAIRRRWLEDVRTVGVTAGASTPERLVARVVAWLRERFDPVVEERGDPLERIEFNLPVALRRSDG